MPDFEEYCEQLAPLETVDPAVFRGDDEVSQPVCDLVLALALAHNDFVDVTGAHEALAEQAPDSEPHYSREWGSYYGVELHLTRERVALIRDLQSLVANGAALLDDPRLQSAARQLHPAAREAWQALVDVAKGLNPTGGVGRTLLLVRNALPPGYDREALARGYGVAFPAAGDAGAFVSRGASLAQTRFYFADAAVQGALETARPGTDWDQLSERVAALFSALDGALMGIVLGFIAARNGQYAPYE